jgi:hypothetical protein
LLLEGNNVQYGNRYYLVISRQIMLDKVDKTILAQLGKNARLSSQEFSGGEVISSVPVMTKVGYAASIHIIQSPRCRLMIS